MPKHSIRLDNINETGRLDRFVIAEELVKSRNLNSQLQIELPYNARYFTNKFRAYRGLGKLASLSDGNKYSALSIKNYELAIGMASIRASNPTPTLIKGKQGVELSYWHKDYPKKDAVEIGGLILNSLLDDAVPALSGVEPNAFKWMVTLPEDEVKANVCTDLGMLSVGVPQTYNLGDRVNIPRQLWVINGS